MDNVSTNSGAVPEQLQFEPEHFMLRAALSIIIFLASAGILCNGLIISAFIRRRRLLLRRKAQLLLLNITVADLFLSVAALIHGLITNATEHQIPACHFTAALVDTLTRISFVFLVFIGIDRYLAILKPLRYSVLIKTRAGVHALCAIAWTIPVFINVPWMIVLKLLYYEKTCLSSYQSNDNVTEINRLLYGYKLLNVVWLPMLTIILSFCYINILLEIRRMRIRFPALMHKPSVSTRAETERLSRSEYSYSVTQSGNDELSHTVEQCFSPVTNKACFSPVINKLNGGAGHINGNGVVHNGMKHYIQNKPLRMSTFTYREMENQRSILQDNISNGHSVVGQKNVEIQTLGKLGTHIVDPTLSQTTMSALDKTLRQSVAGMQVTKFAIENNTLTVSYALNKPMSKNIEKIEINVYTADDERVPPIIDLNSSSESIFSGVAENKNEDRPSPPHLPESVLHLQEEEEEGTIVQETDTPTSPTPSGSSSSSPCDNHISLLPNGDVQEPGTQGGSRRNSFVMASSTLRASFSDLRRASIQALSQLSTQIAKISRIKGSLTIAMIFVFAVVGYSPRFTVSVLVFLNFPTVPINLAIASNVAIAFWPISNAFIYCFRNKEIFKVVFGLKIKTGDTNWITMQ